MRIETWKDGILVATQDVPDPASMIPTAVSMRQARLALLSADALDAVGSIIQTLPRSAQIEWEYASEVKRDSPLISLVESSLGYTPQQIDQLFITAATL